MNSEGVVAVECARCVGATSVMCGSDGRDVRCLRGVVHRVMRR
ncbi:hypothetical protein ERO13_D12G209100v2 [Gossypium hirsutum]|nr:hypothetical protein ERO13_D12G209100v2 [Gossypium hirsutum]